METFINNFKSLVRLVLFLHDPLEQSLRKNRIGANLKVAKIEYTTAYDSATSTSSALSIIKAKWGGNSWPSSNTAIVHGLSGKSLGGGVAYVAVLCNQNYGFGFSASLSGSFRSLDNTAVWDQMVVSHEIG
jgi:hypothetical protein